jgi:predicted enzyme related to lactoylglutathione lyase
MPNPFFWYELMTPDVLAAAEFYADVVGWNTEAFQGGEGYTIVKAGTTDVGGMMGIPAEAAGMPPCWMGYLYTPDVDAATDALTAAGGAILRPPTDIPGVGRFSVVADPQGAAFMMMAPKGDAPLEKPDPAAPGQVGWRELYAGDWEKAFDFYAAQFGWTKADAIDMGPMGTYQLFNAGPDQMGGMMNKPAEMPMPFWLFYFNVPALDAAIARAKARGAKMLNEPMEVPGGGFVVQAMDPQGAMFALAAPRR